ncbi:MAG TPA: MSMEG_0568 family radical SAM protein [Anaeromyxobacter sp.]|nr:MSMEG_0568 family radical SAM protein [Anaeromyxobacter sp.]
MLNDLLEDFITLQLVGARDERGSDGARRGGAGPSDDKAFQIAGHPLMIPTQNRPARTSPFHIVGEADRVALHKGDRKVGVLEPVPRPRFYDLATADGISYEKIARLHGTDVLASTVVQACYRYDDPRTRCRFCAIGVSLARGATIHTKTPAQLAEVAEAAKRLDGVTHVTLTSGTPDEPDHGADYLGACAEAIKQATGLPVQVQLEPPRDLGAFGRMRARGVDDVGLHVESFDEEVRRRVTPGKAEISVEDYFRAFEVAVEVFGRGKVSTYVIVGLGEDPELTLAQCHRAVALGVYPFVVPLRPLEGTFLAKAQPPDAAYVARMYEAVADQLAAAGLSSKDSSAGCVRCRACSLLQFKERP